MFIRAITAVIVTVTHPSFRDTPLVITSKVVGGTGSWETSGTIHFIRTVAAIVHAIATPIGLDAVLVGTGERLGRTGRSW